MRNRSAGGLDLITEFRGDQRGGVEIYVLVDVDAHHAERPELLDDLEMGSQPRHPLAVAQAEGPILDLAIAQPDPEDEAPAGGEEIRSTRRFQWWR